MRKFLKWGYLGTIGIVVSLCLLATGCASTARPAPAAAPTGLSAAPSGGSTRPVNGACPATHPIKGNVGTERIYHVPGGASYKNTKAEACFATPQDAQTAGYRRALR